MWGIRIEYTNKCKQRLQILIIREGNSYSRDSSIYLHLSESSATRMTTWPDIQVEIRRKTGVWLLESELIPR